MMKKIIIRFSVALLILGLVIGLSGCAALKKKFTRKKKEEPKSGYIQTREYDIKPSMDLYEKHYIFWINWHKKLIEELGENMKSDVHSSEESVANLQSMVALLVRDQASLLKPHIDEISKVKAIIVKRNMTKTNETRIRRILETQYRLIKREFSPRHMLGHIRKEW